MNLLRIVFELFALYLLYKLIFNFIIPVIKTTKQVKKQFGDMNARMQEKMNEQQQASAAFKHTGKTVPATEKQDDYIEFEEVPPGNAQNNGTR